MRRFDTVLDLRPTSRTGRAPRPRPSPAARHYVFVSSGAVYRPSPELPWPESTPFGPSPIWGRYGEEKVASERILWDAHADGRFAVTSFRFPFILGPMNFADRESFVFSRLEAGRPILLPGGGDALNQFVYAPDVARALVAALERPDVAAGEAYNCTYQRAITNRGWVELCADVAGRGTFVPIDEGTRRRSRDGRPDEHRLPVPGRALRPRRREARRELGVEMTTGNRRMIEEYGPRNGKVADRAPRRYAPEDEALAALGLVGTAKLALPPGGYDLTAAAAGTSVAEQVSNLRPRGRRPTLRSRRRRGQRTDVT